MVPVLHTSHYFAVSLHEVFSLLEYVAVTFIYYLSACYAGQAGIVFGGICLSVCRFMQNLENYWSESKSNVTW